MVFSSSEHNMLKVSYCDHLLSGVRCLASVCTTEISRCWALRSRSHLGGGGLKGDMLFIASYVACFVVPCLINDMATDTC